MGGDGIYDPKYIEAGRRDQPTLTSPPRSAPRPTPPMAGKTFLEPTRSCRLQGEPPPYGGYAYDAAKAIIEALKTAR
jgi:branched-chain amino acid transport system substrate-binding protein